MRINVNKNSGFTLIELIISLTILGVSIAIGTSAFLNSKKNIKDIIVVNMMREISRDVETAIRQASNMAFSAWSGKNPELLNCVYTWGSSDENFNRNKAFDRRSVETKAPSLCKKTSPKDPQGIHLFKVPRNWNTVKMNDLRIAGTPKNPVWYTTEGKKDCNPLNDVRCRIKAVTWMWATCSRDSFMIRQQQAGSRKGSDFIKTCYRSRTINMRYQISFVDPGIVKKNSECIPYPIRFHSIPRDRVFWEKKCRTSFKGKKVDGYDPNSHSSKLSISITVSEVGRFSDRLKSCPPNYTLLGIKDSNPQCACMAPYREVSTGLSKTCLLDNHLCRENQRYLGTDLDGSPICQDIFCFYKKLQTSGSNPIDLSCKVDNRGRKRKGGWINEIIADKNSQNCVCDEPKENPDPSLAAWSYSCQFHCSFTVRCCFEKK